MRRELETRLSRGIHLLIKIRTNRVNNEVIIDISFRIRVNQNFNTLVFPNWRIVLGL